MSNSKFLFKKCFRWNHKTQLKIYLLLFYIQKYLQFFLPYKTKSRQHTIAKYKACGTPKYKNRNRLLCIQSVHKLSINSFLGWIKNLRFLEIITLIYRANYLWRMTSSQFFNQTQLFQYLSIFLWRDGYWLPFAWMYFIMFSNWVIQLNSVSINR